MHFTCSLAADRAITCTVERSLLDSPLVVVGKSLKLSRNHLVRHGFGRAEQGFRSPQIFFSSLRDLKRHDALARFSGDWSKRVGTSPIVLTLVARREAIDAPWTSWPAIVQQNADFGPVSRAGAIGCRLSSSQLKGKSPLAMELIADRYRNGWGAPGILRRESCARSTRISIERNSRSIALPTNFAAIRLASARGISIAVSGPTGDRLAFFGRRSTISPGGRETARVAREELDGPTSGRSPTPESDRWCGSR